MFAAKYEFTYDGPRDASYYRVDTTCGKRTYGSKRVAKLAHTHTGYRIRAYWCADCGGWHVTNNEKR